MFRVPSMILQFPHWRKTFLRRRVACIPKNFNSRPRGKHCENDFGPARGMFQFPLARETYRNLLGEIFDVFSIPARAGNIYSCTKKEPLYISIPTRTGNIWPTSTTSCARCFNSRPRGKRIILAKRRPFLDRRSGTCRYLPP